MAAPGHLLVDGYNLAHAWPEVREQVGRRLDVAVALVVERVRVIHDVLGWLVTVVFDGRGDRLSLEHPGGVETLTVVFSATGETADAVIERMLARAPDRSGWIVATNDRALGHSAVANGATVLSAGEMAAWAERTEGRAAGWAQRKRLANDRRWRRGGTR